jgi:uncharacterized protein YprB with RNaseH-like and TPR domain
LLNTFALNKTETRKRKEFRCKEHSHDGFEHPRCFDREQGLEEKIGYFDIESSNLTSDFGIILCYAIKHKDGVISNSITPQELKEGSFDKRLLTQLCVDLRKFDRIITWYGYKFDIPYVRSRAMLHKLDFPLYKEISHTDAYQRAKILIRTLHSKRLGVVANFLGIKAKEHPLNPEVWLKCLSGNQDAIDFVQLHCNEDVISLENVWKRLEPYQKLCKTSI